MAVLTIKGISDDLHGDLKRLAVSDGMSLNSFVIGTLAQEASERARLERLAAMSSELESFVATLPVSDDATAIIRADRDRQ